MKALIAIDIQNDFVSGSLGTKEAEAALAKMAEKESSKIQISGPLMTARAIDKRCF